MELLDERQRRESENENLLESHNLEEKEGTPPLLEYDNTNSDFKNTQFISLNKSIEDELNNKNENTANTVQVKMIEESELKSISTNKKHKIRKRILADSDSEEDIENKNTNEKEDTNIVITDLIGSNEAEKELSNTKSRKRHTILESDSEDEIDNVTLTNKDFETNLTNNRNIMKKINFDESDSDLDDQDMPLNNRYSNDKPVDQGAINTSDSEGKLVDGNSTVKKSNWTALCDSESSGPENSDKEHEENSDGEKDCNSDEIIKPIKYKKKKMSEDEYKSHEMTPKEAAKQREEIRSESQRMLRESNISLPYHRPKSFTLKDFLSRRPKFASAVPLAAKMSSSVAIKMSDQHLEVISKKLEERHKEVREFYKSDSEEDSENNEDSEKIEESNSEKPLQTLDDRNETKDIEENIDDIEMNFDDVEKNIDGIEKNNDDIENNIDGIEKNVDDIENINNTETLDVDKNLENIDKKDIKNDSNTCEIIIEDNSTDYNRLTEENENINNIIENKECSEGKKIKIISEYVINDSTKNNYSSIGNILIAEETHTKEHVVVEELNIGNKSVEKNVDISKTNLVDESSAINYEFNLDDIEENSENVLKNDKETHRHVETYENLPQADEKHQNQFVFGEIDKEIENFGNNEQTPLKISDEIGNDDNNEVTVIKNPKFKLERLKSRLSNIKPRLSGDRNQLIDLDSVVKPNEVTKLMERFAQHTAKKVPHHKNKVKLNIVSVEHGGEIHKETLAVNIDDEEDLSIEERPGARLQRLRNELQDQISQRRSEIWQQKSITKDTNELVKDPYDDEKSECGADDAILDDDEEEEMSESSEEDEEEIEDDTIEEKSRKKSIFVQDEAEESDEIDEYQDNFKSDVEENDNDEGVEEDDGVEDKDGVEEDDGVEDDADDEEDKENEADDKNNVSKPLRRIIQCFSEDSDEDEDFGAPGKTIKNIVEKLNRSNEDTNNTQEDYIRPYQLQNYSNKTPIKSVPESSNSDLKFLTPVSYITGLQNLTNSVSKVNVPSPLKETDWHTELEKKLHADSIITNSQAEAMRELVSEPFPESQDVSYNRLENIPSNIKSSDISLDIPQAVPIDTQDVLNICSGPFDGPTSSMPPSTQDILNICSGKFTGISQVSETIPITLKPNRVEEVKYLSEDQDIIISQLINEEEMEAFKKKFDSPVLTFAQRVVEEVEEDGRGGIIDSDEDEEVLEVKKRKRNQKKLTFSDDESSNEDEENGEEIDLHDNVDEEDDAEVLAGEIDYDSEENEIDYSEEKVKETVEMADFFDAEAELSESEWGSADEDEKDLDDLEFEQGDKEKFDEKQLRTDLERIHMRRLLDDDTREVKLLQEMLLDDGELHGTGRERQFKWKNIDSNFPVDEEKKDSDDENCFEDESEEQWRKKRHEREMFLKEKKSQKVKDDDLLSGSEILKLGHKVIQKSMSNSQGGKKSMGKDDVSCSPAVKRNFSLLHKRGSFLTRGDQVLDRLAEFNKITTSATLVTGKTVKNSKNFLFQTVAQETITTTSVLNLKRKADDGTPKVIKKLRLTDNLSPALNRKKKSDKQVKMKLFGVS